MEFFRKSDEHTADLLGTKPNPLIPTAPKNFDQMIKNAAHDVGDKYIENLFRNAAQQTTTAQTPAAPAVTASGPKVSALDGMA